MAINPMQRRARNSFLIGFLLGLVIVIITVIILMRKINSLKKSYDALVALQTQAPVALGDIESGAELTTDMFGSETVQTTLSPDNFISEMDFENIDEETGDVIEETDENGNPIQRKLIVKTNIPAGSIITKDMIEFEEEKLTSDQRLQEYNMIILPTLLKNNDYIDIRLKLPEAEDYIVLSKKKVIYSNADTVWLKMTEAEMLTLGNAIVEAYTMVGSKLYATLYTEARRQDAAVANYPVSRKVLELINADPNIVKEAREALWSRYNEEQRENNIEAVLSENYDSMTDAVNSGLQQEVSKIKESRQSYVESLGGVGIGTEQ